LTVVGVLIREVVSPQTDDAEEYIKDHPLYIPFQRELFSGKNDLYVLL
jgi:hypothetical protein